MILDEIAAWKRRELAAARAERSVADLKALLRGAPPVRPFAIRKEGEVRIIAEIKRATPSKGDLAPRLDPAAMAAAYERGGAAALSVLTESRFFKGSADDLRAARGAVQLPVLRKDFVLDEYQILEARTLPADAVLLISRLLDRSQLGEYVHLAHELGMASLVEVHDERDLDLAREALDRIGGASGRAAVGINNRNLETFRVSIETTLRLAGAVGGDRTVVSESGIASRADLDLVKAAGAHAALIGERLVTSPDPASALRELRGCAPTGRATL